ncbi:transcription factor [Apiospora arundinis]|uniref:Transcription factor n=1 Tax=Apiospora arundinis TaxID=335852 RepID=A0ABR2I4I2_9PEZI
MAPGRPPKRPGDAEYETPDSHNKCKLPKLDRMGSGGMAGGGGAAPNDFSSVVKSKLQSYTRTGQACDRCKVRKIRCDALPEGCSHCINQNLECYVTDRVTGRTERRGYMQELEREKSDMMNHIRELEQLLGANGIEVKTFQGRASAVEPSHSPTGNYDAMGNMMSCRSSGSLPSGSGKENWQPMSNSVWVKPNGPNGPNGQTQTRAPKTQFTTGVSRSMLEPRPADFHIGVTTDKAVSSSIKGTTLTILGSTIDVCSFDAEDMDEPAPGAQPRSALYNKSVQALMMSACNANPPLHVDYPPRPDAFHYAEWYFLIMYPFLPILHRPTFMDLLGQLYDDPNFKPTVAETVMVHMVFACIYLQIGLRNRENPEQKHRLNELSNKHYHYALSKFVDLTTSRTFADMQALVMIAVHTRSFPKPDCSGMMTHYCVGLATELGLHRTPKKAGEAPTLETEMRRRLWWTIVSMAVTLNGRMGRPMGIRLEEFDVPFPELIPDEMLTSDGVDTTRGSGGRCSYEIGVAGYKISALFLEMYSTIYACQRDAENYVKIVEELEDRLQAWRDELPQSLRYVEGGDNQMHALYVQYIDCEFRLMVRHPSVALTQDPKVLAESTRLCEQAAKDMLQCVYKLYKIKSIDTTYYQQSVYIAAAFASMAAVWERRHEVTSVEVESLRHDMGMWLDILSETSNIIGSGNAFQDAVRSIVDRTISWIERDRQRKTAGGVIIPVTQEMLKQSPQTPTYTSLPSAPGNTSSNHNGAEHSASGTPTTGMPTSRNSYFGEATTDASSYPPIPYGDSSGHGAPNSMQYDGGSHQFMYAQGPDQVTAAHHVQAQNQAQQVQSQQQAQQQNAQPPNSQAQTPVTDHNPLTAFAAQATQIAQPDMLWRQQAAAATGGNTWQDWTAAIVDNQDRYSANALMSLGHGARSGNIVNDGSNGGQPDLGMGVGMNGAPGVPVTATMQWPLLLFHDGTNVGGA